MIKSEILGRDYLANTYEYGTHLIRLFDDGVPLIDIKREYENTLVIKEVYPQTLPVIELIKVDAQWGIVIKKTNSVSMLKQLELSPERLD